MDSTKRYVNFVQRHPWCLVLVFVVLAGVAAPFMVKLGSTTTDHFGASPGTPSYAETELLGDAFPAVFNDIETLYVHCAGNCTVDQFQSLFDRFSVGMQQYLADGTLAGITNYFSYSDRGELSYLGQGYYNATAQSMLATLEFDTCKGDAALSEAVTQAIDVSQELTEGSMAVYVTGQVSARLLATDAAGKLIGMADGTGMIFIVLLFGWQVRSWRLTLIPVFNTGLCLIIAEALIYPFSKSGAITLPSYVPNVCLFLSIALSVDYSFFHLSRFQEVRREGADLVDAVDAMVRTAGRVVLVSGVVLLFTWLALAAFPVFGTDSLGYCASITIFVCITVNLTMNPALIFAFPKFFERAGQDPCRCCRRRRVAEAEQRAPLAEASPEETSKNCYGRMAGAIVKMPCMIIVPLLVYALLLPGAIRLFTAELVVGGINGGTDDTEYASNQILKDFPGSQGGVPLTVLLEAPGGSESPVKSDVYFERACSLMRGIQNHTESLGVRLSDFRGPMFLDNDCINWTAASADLETSDIYQYFWNRSVNPENTSSLVTVSLPFDAFSDEAKTLIKMSRAAVDEFRAQYNYGKVAVFHPMAIEVDAEQLTAARFPWVVLITLVVVFSVIALRYRAALIPVKLFFTIALPIISVLGTGVFVFQDGALDWTHIPSLQQQGGLVWINPVACTFMLIGFALDYDIFLFSRIYADRRSGLFREDREAIVHAVAKTGPIITTAGVIMALAFSGMVVQSTNPFLCQMGFTMIFGILMDTFIVRTLLVPAFLSMAGKYNWWPGKMPGPEDQVDH